MFHPVEIKARGFVFFLLGTILLGVGADSYSKADKYYDTAETALAVVTGIDVEEGFCLRADKQGNEACERYNPQVQFLTRDSRIINFSSHWGTRERTKYKVGDQFEVLYAPDNPQDVRLEVPLAIYRYPLVLVLLGSLGSLTGTYFLAQLALRRREIQGLIESGEQLVGRVIGVKVQNRPILATLLRGFGDDYLIEVEVSREQLPDVKLRCFSQPFSRNPTERLHGLEALPVYMDPLFPERYYVDISELPPAHALRDKQGRILPS
ncbi:MAG: DUF3592 domain-containing protein [Oligoflexia bacterium]|nr:DUF3592 domain-containing protein [Oligoflexia bacterium]